MVGKNTVRHSLYISVVVIILGLTGVFDTFGAREVIADTLSLDAIALFLMVASASYIVANPLREKRITVSAVNGAIGGLIIALVLTALIIIETLVLPETMLFVFQNFSPLIGSIATFGYGADELATGLFFLISFGVVVGGLLGSFVSLPNQLRDNIILAVGFTTIIGLMFDQVDTVMTMPDALPLILALVGGYVAALQFSLPNNFGRLIVGFIPGAIVAVIVFLLLGAGALEEGGLFFNNGNGTKVLEGINGNLIAILAVFGLTGSFGAMLTQAPRSVHNGMIFFALTVLALGIANTQQDFTLVNAVIIIGIYFAGLMATPNLSEKADAKFQANTPPQQATVRRTSGVVGLFIVLIAPLFLTQYITNVLDIVMLYIIMGIGLNVMVGFAGLLDLGYVASFAIGAYTSALLTTSNVITVGCAPILAEAMTALEVDSISLIGPAIQEFLDAGRTIPSRVPDFTQACSIGALQGWQGTGILSFWGAWPVAILVSAFTGMALGVPVLGLRGDYLAIVTLGFGEITRVLVRSNVGKPLLGASQGISPVPFPTLDLTFLNPEWYIEFSDASSIYYLYVFAVLVAAFVVYQLSEKRLGRAWRALKADEDVAEAMGVHLIRTKLLAFGISSAFAGLGGAIFAAQLRGIFPDSFTILVSINVLSLIIIGGLGSIPGVIVGAFILVGLPEALRELQGYRLLAFGSLLVIAMLAKPEGIIPPRVAQLSSRIRGKPASQTPQVAAEGQD